MRMLPYGQESEINTGEQKRTETRHSISIGRAAISVCIAAGLLKGETLAKLLHPVSRDGSRNGNPLPNGGLPKLGVPFWGTHSKDYSMLGSISLFRTTTK